MLKFGEKPRRLWVVLAAFVTALALFGLYYGLAGSPVASEEARLREAVLNDPANADARIALAAFLAEKQAWPEAIVTLQDGLRLSPEHAGLARTLADAYWVWADQAKDEKKRKRARRYLQMAVEAGEATGREYAQLGYLLQTAEEFEGAAHAYDEAWRRNPDRIDLLRQAWDARMRAGRYEEMRDFGHSLLEKDPNDAWAWYAMGSGQYLLGEYDEGVKSLRRSIELADGNQRPVFKSALDYALPFQSKEKSMKNFQAHFKLADWHAKRNRLDRAAAEYQAALNVCAESNWRSAWAYARLADVALMLDDSEQAYENVEQAVAGAKKASQYSLLGTCYQLQANICTLMAHRFPEREDTFKAKTLEARENLLNLCRQHGMKHMEIHALADLAFTALDFYGPDDDRTRKYREDMAPYVPTSDTALDCAVGSIATTEARFLMYEKKWGKAEELLLKAVATRPHVNDKGRPYIYVMLAMSANSQQKFDKAVEYARAGVGVMNDMRQSMGIDQFRQKIGGDLWRELFTCLIQTAVAKSDMAAVFDYSEEYKARALLEVMGTKAETRRGRERILLAQAEPAPAARFEAEADVEEAPQSKNPLRDLELEQSHYQRLPEDVTPAQRQVASNTRMMTIKSGAAQDLAADFTFISYGVGSDETIAVVLTAEGVQAVELAGVNEPVLREKIKQFRRGLGLRGALQRDLTIESNRAAEDGRDESQEVLEELYELLFAPVRPYIRNDLVYISADSVLNYLPFEALRHDGRYLIEDYAIAYTPSATVLKACMDKERHGRSSVLALGNPNLQNPAFRLINAEEEVQALSDLFEKANVLTGDAANERVVQEQAGQYDVLHFACHGELNLDEPMLTSLRLSPDGENDGYLHAGEVFDLDLNASLVVLSACNTGLGELRTGNELMGLTRSFLYAGAPSIVASLWTVDDRSTAFLMRAFYKNLASMNKAEALRQAKLATMKQYPGPFHWAAFCLQGDYRS